MTHEIFVGINILSAILVVFFTHAIAIGGKMSRWEYAFFLIVAITPLINTVWVLVNIVILLIPVLRKINEFMQKPVLTSKGAK